MRKIFNKMLAGITSVALVATLLVGINVTKTVKGDDAVALSNWSFAQGGQYNPSEPGNEGYIGSVTMNGTNEVISGWLTAGEASVNQTQSAKQSSTGFALAINNTGWDAVWDASPLQINPWSIQAIMGDVNITPGHIYTVSFKAHATKKKYAYVAFGSDVTGATPYGEAPVEGDKSIIALSTAEKTFTYTFTNWVEAKKMTVTLMLGAFDAQYDYAGNNVSDIVTEVENVWSGTVYVNDFTITDKGVNPDYVAPPSKDVEVTTQAPTTNNNNNNNNNNNPTVAPTTQAPTTKAPATKAPTTKAPTVKKLAKVKKVKAKNNKKKAIKITWKKVANAKKYQVKVGKKTYNTSKTKLTVKKLVKGKKYKVKVRAKAAGYKTGAWSKVVKVKIKK